MNWLVRFGAFWYDFIVGDSVVLAIGSVLALAATGLFIRAGGEMIAPLALPLLIALTLGASLRWPR